MPTNDAQSRRPNTKGAINDTNPFTTPFTFPNPPSPTPRRREFRLGVPQPDSSIYYIPHTKELLLGILYFLPSRQTGVLGTRNKRDWTNQDILFLIYPIPYGYFLNIL